MRCIYFNADVVGDLSFSFSLSHVPTFFRSGPGREAEAVWRSQLLRDP